MYPHNLTLIAQVNDLRRAELLRQAEIARRAQACRSPRLQTPDVVTALRQRVGTALVRAGQRVHGAPAGGDAVTALPGALRTAR